MNFIVCRRSTRLHIALSRPLFRRNLSFNEIPRDQRMLMKLNFWRRLLIDMKPQTRETDGIHPTWLSWMVLLT